MKNIVLLSVILVFHFTFYAQQEIVWATYFGGNDDESEFKILNLENGSSVIAGNTLSGGLATVGAYQTEIGGSFDGVVALLDPYGHVSWCTYFGANDYDYLMDAAISPQGNICIVGLTGSMNGIANNGFQMEYGGAVDCFVAEFSSSGSLLWSSYFGGNSGDVCQTIAFDNQGDMYIAGKTSSNDLAFGSVQMTQHSAGENDDCFLMKIEDSIPTWCTYYGGTEEDIILEISCSGTEKINVTGSTKSQSGIASANSFQSALQTDESPFLAQFNNQGMLIWGTYWGQNTDIIEDSKTDTQGNIYLTGYSTSGSTLSTSGAFQENLIGEGDAFLAKFNENGLPEWCTFYGGDGQTVDRARCLLVEESSIYMGGSTSSTNGISTAGTLNVSAPDNGTSLDGFVTKFDSDGNRIWGTYIGANGGDRLYSLSKNNSRLYMSFYTSSINWDTTDGLQENSGGGFFDCVVVCMDEAVSAPALTTNPFNIYPNPAGETLRLTLPSTYSVSGIEILDTKMQISHSIPVKFAQSNMEIPISNLSSGVYFLRLISDNKYYNSISFIKL